MKNKKNKRKILAIIGLFIPMFICYGLIYINDIFVIAAYVFLFAILGIIFSMIFDKLKNKFSNRYERDLRKNRRIINFFYKDYSNKIKKELNRFKNEAKTIAKDLGCNAEIIDCEGVECLTIIHPTGIYAVNFDETPQKLAGSADDKTFTTYDERYVEFGCKTKENKAPAIADTIRRTLLLTDDEVKSINVWTVHSSYCLYSILPSADGRFRHINTKNFKDCLKEYLDNPIKVFDNSEFNLTSDLLEETLEY
jgi:hypothetical protein